MRCETCGFRRVSSSPAFQPRDILSLGHIRPAAPMLGGAMTTSFLEPAAPNDMRYKVVNMWAVARHMREVAGGERRPRSLDCTKAGTKRLAQPPMSQRQRIMRGTLQGIEAGCLSSRHRQRTVSYSRSHTSGASILVLATRTVSKRSGRCARQAKQVRHVVSKQN